MNDIPEKNIVPLPNPSTQRRMILLGFVILAAGMVIGAALTTIISRHQQTEKISVTQNMRRKSSLEELRRRLDLTDQQFEKIKPIYKEHMEALQKIQTQARPLIQKELKQMNLEITEILTEEQERRWENQIERLQRGFGRREQRRRRGAPYGTMPGPDQPQDQHPDPMHYGPDHDNWPRPQRHGPMHRGRFFGPGSPPDPNF